MIKTDKNIVESFCLGGDIKLKMDFEEIIKNVIGYVGCDYVSAGKIPVGTCIWSDGQLIGSEKFENSFLLLNFCNEAIDRQNNCGYKEFPKILNRDKKEIINGLKLIGEMDRRLAKTLIAGIEPNFFKSLSKAMQSGWQGLMKILRSAGLGESDIQTGEVSLSSLLQSLDSELMSLVYEQYYDLFLTKPAFPVSRQKVRLAYITNGISKIFTPDLYEYSHIYIDTHYGDTYYRNIAVAVWQRKSGDMMCVLHSFSNLTVEYEIVSISAGQIRRALRSDTREVGYYDRLIKALEFTKRQKQTIDVLSKFGITPEQVKMNNICLLMPEDLDVLKQKKFRGQAVAAGLLNVVSDLESNDIKVKRKFYGPLIVFPLYENFRKENDYIVGLQVIPLSLYDSFNHNFAPYESYAKNLFTPHFSIQTGFFYDSLSEGKPLVEIKKNSNDIIEGQSYVSLSDKKNDLKNCLERKRNVLQQFLEQDIAYKYANFDISILKQEILDIENKLKDLVDHLNEVCALEKRKQRLVITDGPLECLLLSQNRNFKGQDVWGVTATLVFEDKMIRQLSEYEEIVFAYSSFTGRKGKTQGCSYYEWRIFDFCQKYTLLLGKEPPSIKLLPLRKIPLGESLHTWDKVDEVMEKFEFNNPFESKTLFDFPKKKYPDLFRQIKKNSLIDNKGREFEINKGLGTSFHRLMNNKQRQADIMFELLKMVWSVGQEEVFEVPIPLNSGVEMPNNTSIQLPGIMNIILGREEIGYKSSIIQVKDFLTVLEEILSLGYVSAEYQECLKTILVESVNAVFRGGAMVSFFPFNEAYIHFFSKTFYYESIGQGVIETKSKGVYLHTIIKDILVLLDDFPFSNKVFNFYFNDLYKEIEPKIRTRKQYKQ